MTVQITGAPDRAALGWSSRAMFIVAAAGSAVGLGNVWKFPYIVGENGGGAFVLIYLACLALLGLPILIAEIAIGARGGARPGAAFQQVAAESGRSRHWRLLGDLGAFTGLIILSFYTVVAAWVGLYALHYVQESLALATPIARPDAFFAAITNDSAAQAAAAIMTVAAGAAIMMRNAVRGIEAAMRGMAPIFIASIALLALVVIFATPEPLGAAAYLLRPDFSALTLDAVSEAIGHAFFTLSIGMCGMLVYGAYLPSGAGIGNLAVTVAFIDTAISMACAFVVMGVAFSSNADPAQGPGLIFVVLPDAFARLPGGPLLAAVFFVTVFMAAFSSIIAVMFVVTRSLEDVLSLTPRAASLACAGAILAGALAVIASVSGLLEVQLFGLGLFDLLDSLASSILLPISGIGVALFAARTMREPLRSLRGGAAILFCLRFIAPLGLVGAAISKLS